MGATNCPETPRQRMIGMMYLVLTAMLALNVSKNILDAFTLIDEATTVSINNTTGSINSNIDWLNRQLLLKGEDKIGDPLRKMNQLKETSDAMVAYIENLRNDLLKNVDKSDVTERGEQKAVKDIKSKEDISKTTNYIYKSGKAEELKNEIKKFKSSILLLLDQKNSKEIEKISGAIGLDLDGEYYTADGKPEDWAQHTFNNTILAAVVTMLNKTIGDVRSAQAAVSKSIIDAIEGDNFKFDKIDGKAIPYSRMVFRGQGYNADVIVAAYDSKIPATAYYKMGIDTLLSSDGATKLTSVDGVVKLTIPTGSIGEQRYAGYIEIKGPDGLPKQYSFKDKYTIIEPIANIAADKMNVLYANIENPITVSAPGIISEKISLSIEGCSTNKNGAGKFVVTPSPSLIGRTVTANASAVGADNKNQSLGSLIFRVKRVPDPMPQIGGVKTGSRTKQEVLSNPRIVAKMDEGFVFDLQYSVVSFQIIFVDRGGIADPPVSVQGNTIPENVQAKIRSAQPRSQIQVTGIRVSSQAGTTNIGTDILISLK